MRLEALIGSTVAVLAFSAYACAAERESGATIEFRCAGKLADDGSAAPGGKGPTLTFEVSAAFGEGEILALVDPETRKLEQPLYDAETTSGPLRFGDGDAATIVWTRMSGRDGPLTGEAVLSDGNVAALSIDRPSEAAGARPFILFLAADVSLYRGVCSEK